VAAAVGLGVAGAAALVVAWVLGDDFAQPAPGPWWPQAGTVVLILVLAVLVWTRRQVFVLAMAVVALVVTVIAVLGFVDQYSRGFPGRATVVTALGGLAVTVAALLLVRAGPRYGWHPVTVVAFLLVPVVATPLALAAPGLRVDATTAGAAKAAAVPASVSRVAWSTELDGQVQDVVPAGTGVVVLLADGVVALDGQTGAIRWRRTRHGAEAVQLGASPDGRTVVVQFQPRDPTGGHDVWREVIDAFTGEVRFTADDTNEDTASDFVPFITPVTDTSYIGATDDEQEFFGNSLTDGTRLWSYRPPRDCWLMPEQATARTAVAAGILLPLACRRHGNSREFTEFRYVLVDATTGAVRWEHRIQPPWLTGRISVLAQLAPDRRFVTLDISEDGSTTPATHVVLDISTGDALPFTEPVQLLAGGIGILRTRDSEKDRLVDMTTGETVPSTDDVRRCAVTYQAAFLEAGVVCPDPAFESVDGFVNDFDGLVDTGRIELGVGTYEAQDIDPVSVTLGPRFDRWSSDDEIILVPAPSAVVFTTPLTPYDGRVRVVGLR
jgi:outer membrane protein assembly factor BamB